MMEDIKYISPVCDDEEESEDSEDTEVEEEEDHGDRVVLHRDRPRVVRLDRYRAALEWLELERRGLGLRAHHAVQPQGDRDETQDGEQVDQE